MKALIQIPSRADRCIVLIWPLLIFYPFSAKAATTAGTVSIENTPGYLAQRDCVQSALWSGRNAAGESNIVDWLGCTNHLDSCFCRADLASSASSLLTSGINSFCSSDTTDVASGIAVYNSYCSRAGPATVDTAVTTTGSDSLTTTTTAMQTVYTSTAPQTTSLESPVREADDAACGSETFSNTRGSEAGSTAASSSTTIGSTTNPGSAASSSTGSGGLNQSDQIAIGLGLGVGLPIGLVGLWLSFRMLKEMRSQ